MPKDFNENNTTPNIKKAQAVMKNFAGRLPFFKLIKPDTAKTKTTKIPDAAASLMLREQLAISEKTIPNKKRIYK